jgi:hypothetical protein|tara:strand:+ start:978 stop:1097 length:120 start_codon:yes stop_codon:yes gene_type:complete
MKRFIKRVLFWLRGYRTVGPKQTPDIKKKPTKQDAARLQ